MHPRHAARGLQQDTSIHIAHMLSLNHGIEKLYIGKRKVKGNITLTTYAYFFFINFAIRIGKHNIRDEGARQLASKLRGNRSLQFLDMRANQIGPSGAEAMAELLVRNTSLLGINLESNRFKNEGSSDVYFVALC